MAIVVDLVVAAKTKKETTRKEMKKLCATSVLVFRRFMFVFAFSTINFSNYNSFVAFNSF